MGLISGQLKPLFFNYYWKIKISNIRYLETMNSNMMPAAFLPQQMVDPRKLGLVRMSPYDMAQQQAQMQQMFRLQQMNGIQR